LVQALCYKTGRHGLSRFQCRLPFNELQALVLNEVTSALLFQLWRVYIVRITEELLERKSSGYGLEN
jgi:hypothetical protein